MTRSSAQKILLFITLLILSLLAGCAGTPNLKSVSKTSESKRQYLGLKKVAVLPFINIAGEKDSESKVMGIIISELNIKGTFEEVEDSRYVKSVMKVLKLRNVEELDLEVVQKLGNEMNSQAIIIGEIHAWGLGEGSEAAMHVSLVLTLLDTQTGKPVWMGSAAHRASFTVARAFGLNEGPTDLEVGRKVIASLVSDMDKEIGKRRNEELVRIRAEEESKLKAAAEAEKRRLEELLK